MILRSTQTQITVTCFSLRLNFWFLMHYDFYQCFILRLDSAPVRFEPNRAELCFSVSVRFTNLAKRGNKHCGTFEENMDLSRIYLAVLFTYKGMNRFPCWLICHVLIENLVSRWKINHKYISASSYVTYVSMGNFRAKVRSCVKKKFKANLLPFIFSAY